MRLLIKSLCLLLFFHSSLAFSIEFKFLTRSNGKFANPHDLVLDNQKKLIYVADLGLHQIHVVDAMSLKTVFTFGKDLLSSPHDVAFSENNLLYVADTGNDRIAVFSIQANKAQYKSEFTGLQGPEGVDVQGNRIYFSNTISNQIGYIEDGKIKKIIGKYGSAAGEFVRPHDIEINQGRVYVGDPGNNRIQWFNKELEYIGELKRHFKEPKYLALSTSGYLFVADQHNNRLRVFDNKLKWQKDIINAGMTPLNFLEGVEVVDQNLWIADTYNHRILKYEIAY